SKWCPLTTFQPGSRLEYVSSSLPARGGTPPRQGTHVFDAKSSPEVVAISNLLLPDQCPYLFRDAAGVHSMLGQKLLRRATLAKRISQSDSQQPPRQARLRQRFGDGRAETPDDLMILRSDDSLGAGGGAEHPVDVQGLDGVHVHHADL